MTKRTVLIGGVDIFAYRIVYGDSVLHTKIGSDTDRTVGEDIGAFLLDENRACDFDRQSAERLAAVIRAFCGITLETVCISDCKTRAEHEILLGKTDAAQDLEPTAYVCKQMGGKYVICGGSYGATWHAIDRIEACLKHADGVVDLADAGDLSGTYPIKMVACLGDSITRGSQSLPDANGFGTPDGLAASFGPAATSHYFERYLGYPANLQRMLWKDYLIFNFGQGCASMRKYADWMQFYYHGTAKYASCLELSNRDGFSFDAVLIMLGTNDSGKEGGAKTWSDAQKADYQTEAEVLLSELCKGSSKARFALMNVPHRCDSFKPSQSDETVRAIQKETARALKAKGYDVCHFDMNGYTCANMGNGHGDTKEAEIEAHADYYNIRTETGKPDTTHPNYRGYHKIAEGVRGLVAYLLDGAEPPKNLTVIE